MDIKRVEKGRIALKNKKIAKIRYNRYLLSIIFFFIAGYGFFFSTKFWYVDDSDLVKASPMLQTKSSEDRNIQLLAWNYSPRQKTMEIQFTIDNNSQDGIDSYDFTVIEQIQGNVDFELVLEQNDLYVVHLYNIDEDWLQIAFKLHIAGEEESLAKFFTNKNAVSVVENIEVCTYNQYMMARLDLIISGYLLEIENLYKLIDEEQAIINNCSRDIVEYENKKLYQTDAQKMETDTLIKNAQNKIAASEAAIQSYDELIVEYKERIELSNKEKDTLK